MVYIYMCVCVCHVQRPCHPTILRLSAMSCHRARCRGTGGCPNGHFRRLQGRRYQVPGSHEAQKGTWWLIQVSKWIITPVFSVN